MIEAIVVDDSATARMVICQCLKIASGGAITPIEKGSAQEALESIKKKKPAVVFTDLNMPDTNGMEFIKAIRQDSQYDDTPIVVISSTINKRKEEELIKAGACKVLIKPVSPPQFNTCLKELHSKGLLS